MNKDLSKEYKEAVMNDLPDLWGRIEAAIDEEEKNEPVKGQTTKKKKFRIPGWVFVAVPSAAILLLVIIPVGLLMIMGGLGSKSAAPTTTANFAYDASPAAPTTTDEAATEYYDAAATWDEAATYEDEYDFADSTQEYKNAITDYDITLGQDKLDGLQGLMENFDGTNSDSATTLAPTEREADSRVINDSVTVKFLSVYENKEGKKLADVEIIGVSDDYLVIPEDFDGFEAGETITAYLKPDFKDVDFTKDAEYDCIINYVPDDEIGYEIEFKTPSRTEDY